jgi:hypothetical protein
MIMEWLILLLLVPAILVPIVLLCGFAGCFLDSIGEAGPPPPPTNLKATAIGTDGIKLEWTDTSEGTVTFNVERLDADTFEVIAPNASSPSEDGGRNDGTDHTYRVTASEAGFADSGPSNEATATTHPQAPTNLVLTPQDVDQIDLEWNHVTESNKTINFKVEHRVLPGGSWGMIEVVSGVTTYSHNNLAPGSALEYQVTAQVDGFDNSVATVVSSNPSAAVSATPFAFTADLSTDQPGLEGFCLIQKISKTLLKNSGTQVRITLRGPSIGNLTINRIYISQVAAAGDPYDSLAPGSPVGLTKVVDIDQGDPAVVLPVIASPDPTATTLGLITYTLDRTKDLLIAFDISATAGQGNVRSVLLPGTGTEHYFRAATQQASVPDRSPSPVLPPPGFTTGPDRLYLIEKIEVL